MYHFHFVDNASVDNLRDNVYTFDYVKNIYKTGGYSQLDNLMFYGYIKCLGWCYVFDELKKYVVKCSYGLREYYAPNKTLLRKNIHTKIEYILEVK